MIINQLIKKIINSGYHFITDYISFVKVTVMFRNMFSMFAELVSSVAVGTPA